MKKDYEIKTKATVVTKTDSVEQFSLDSFGNINTITKEITSNNKPTDIQEVKESLTIDQNKDIDEIKQQISSLNQTISSLANSINTLKQQSFSNKDLDAQIIKALKELDQVSIFYKEAMGSFEQKLLKTSFSIAKKIINIEVSQNSANIAKETINNLMLKLKQASKITIHLNPKDFLVLKNEIKSDEIVSIVEDGNIMPGGVVIVSDIGNFDGNIEAKINSIYETLELIS